MTATWYARSQFGNLEPVSLEGLVETKIFPRMIEDYARFMDPNESEVTAKMNVKYVASLKLKTGSKYIKVFSEGHGVKMFIVREDGTKGFKRGDILKPASWNAPATNFARGNIFSNLDGITWTGA